MPWALFTLGIAEFTMMGILGDVASNLDISIAKAGHLISAYALGVAIGAPMLIFLRKWPLKRVLLLLAALIVVGNTAAALSPGYAMLLIARFVSGLPHGAFFGTGAIVCSKLAGQGRGAEAVAVMVGGMTVANVIGVPAATYVTTALSWRIAFAIVAFFGLTAFAGIRVWMPYLQPLPDTGLKGQFRFLKSLAPWLIYAGVFFGQMSVYCYFSYVEPVMTELTGFTMSDMTWIMVLAGEDFAAVEIFVCRYCVYGIVGQQAHDDAEQVFLSFYRFFGEIKRGVLSLVEVNGTVNHASTAIGIANRLVLVGVEALHALL